MSDGVATSPGCGRSLGALIGQVASRGNKVRLRLELAQEQAASGSNKPRLRLRLAPVKLDRFQESVMRRIFE